MAAEIKQAHSLLVSFLTTARMQSWLCKWHMAASKYIYESPLKTKYRATCYSWNTFSVLRFFKLLSAVALVSSFLITPPSVVLLFKNTVVALVSTKPNTPLCVIRTRLFLSNLSSYVPSKKGLFFFIKDYVSCQIACASCKGRLLRAALLSSKTKGSVFPW